MNHKKKVEREIGKMASREENSIVYHKFDKSE